MIVIAELLAKVTVGLLGAYGAEAGIISRIVEGAPVPTELKASTRTL